MAEEKANVADINRSLYDFRYEEKESEFYRIREGLDESIVNKISEVKQDPQWMKEFRLKSLRLFNSINEPDWGPDIKDLDIQKIVTYREKEHDLLMDIRNGKYLDSNRQPITEFYEMVDEYEKKLEYAKNY